MSEDDDYSEEVDYTLDEYEWLEEYPELDESLYCRHCGKEYDDFSDLGCEYCDLRYFSEICVD